jgi:hypothetical protein
MNTFNLLFEFEKLEDCERLIDPTITMLTQIKEETKKPEKNDSLHTKNKSSTYEAERNPILSLEFTLNTAILLKAILNLR